MSIPAQTSRPDLFGRFPVIYPYVNSGMPFAKSHMKVDF